MQSTTLPDKPLNIYPVLNFNAAEEMREIRNEVAGFMTHNTAQISYREQFMWYQDVYRPKLAAGEMEAFLGKIGRVAVGYGIIQTIDHKKWVTGAIVAGARGHGWGEDLFAYLTKRVHETEREAWLDVREDNTRAIALYQKLGYTAVEQTDGLIIMKHEVPHVR